MDRGKPKVIHRFTTSFTHYQMHTKRGQKKKKLMAKQNEICSNHQNMTTELIDQPLRISGDEQ